MTAAQKRASPTSREIRRRECVACGSAFFPTITQINAGGGKYCSRPCHQKRCADERERLAMEGTKTCATCGEAKPYSAFSLNKKLLPKSAHCTPCNSKRRAERKRTKFPPGQPKPPEQIERERAYTRAYEERNRERRKKMNHENYLKNKEKVLARSLAWTRAHPEVSAARMARRRARMSAADSHTAEDILQLLKLQRGLCAVCRCDIRGGYHVDHILPLAKGGGNEKTNIQLLCPTCNCSKNAKHPVDFMQERGFLL